MLDAGRCSIVFFDVDGGSIVFWMLVQVPSFLNADGGSIVFGCCCRFHLFLKG